MRRDAPVLAIACLLMLAGCSRLERLSIVRPTAERGDYTRVAPVYDVSDKGRRDRAGVTAAPAALAAATDAYRAGRFLEARQHATVALKADPQSVAAHTLLGAIAEAQGDAGTAGRHYQQATALAPADGNAANNYGAWLCSNGRAADALPWFQRAVQDDAYPTPAAALANAGTCSMRAARTGQAEQAWRQALALDPANVQALGGLARLSYDQGRFLEARAFSERRLAAAAPDAPALQLASQIELKLGDTAASSRYLHQLRTLSPGADPAPNTQ